MEWTIGIDYPAWGNNEMYLKKIKSYLNNGETPYDLYTRLAKTASELIDPSVLRYKMNKIELQAVLFEILWNGWLIPSTPVAVNFGTNKGLPISCFSGIIEDDMHEIGRKNVEMMMLSKHGGGTAYDFSSIRPLGSPIKGGELGKSDGIIPFMKIFDSSIIACKQGQTRRGAVALYLDINHDEYPEFLRMRKGKGADIDRQCMRVHHGAVIDDNFMKAVIKGGSERNLWLDTLENRVTTGEPYLFFKDNANKTVPAYWKEIGLEIKHSNLCAEIMQPTDYNHTFVCDLSALNLYKYDEWKGYKYSVPYLATVFLDAIMQEFIDKAQWIKGIEDTVSYAIKSRALGLVVMGWHSLLQKKRIPFISLQSNFLTQIIFKYINEESLAASKDMAKMGIPEWCKDTRNLVRMAIAPTRSSSKLAGGISQGIEPLAANLYMDDDASAMFIRKNPELEKLLIEKGLNSDSIWNSIQVEGGSVQHLTELTQEERDIFKTFKEINQLELVKQAALRQKFIDQGMSLNLSFYQNATAEWINKVHLNAWSLGLKSLYYFRSESKLKADNITDLYDECIMCEG